MAQKEITQKMRAKTRGKVKELSETPTSVKNALMDTLRWVPKEDPITVFLSSGIDSHACLFACLELGLNVSALSFRLDTHESTDFKLARDTAQRFNIPFHEVKLNSDVDHLKKWVLFAVNKLGAEGKSSIECMWPLYCSVKKAHAVGAKHIVAGMGGDNFYLLAKKVAMHCQDLVPEVRRIVFRSESDQNSLLKRMAFQHGMYAHLPFYEFGRVYAELETDTDYVKINSPQKAMTNQAWPELKKLCKVKPHQNFQLGDTNISGIFADKLLASDWNTRGLKSVVGIYNDVAAGLLK